MTIHTNYILRKIHIETQSRVPVGMKCESTNLTVRLGEDIIYGAVKSDIVVGSCIVLYNNIFDFIKTSDINEVLQITHKEIHFKTESSTYQLIEL